MNEDPNQINKGCIGCIGLIALAFLLALIFPSDPAKRRQDDADAMAVTLCQQHIKQRLKAPSTASFPWGYSRNLTHVGDKYIYAHYVDAQNSFGAMLRNNFVCTVGPVKGDDFSEARVRVTMSEDR